MTRIYAHAALLAFVCLVIGAELAGAMPLTGTSKAVYYTPGLFRRVAERNGVWGTSPDGCYLSSPLSDDIGSEWVVRGPKATLRCIQADVSHPAHKRRQLKDNRLIETDAASMRRLVGFLPAPDEATITFRRVR